MHRTLLAALLAGVLCHGEVFAQRLAAGIDVGTLGAGVELTTGLNDRVNVRGAAHLFTYGRQDAVSNLEVAVLADSELKLASGSVLVDYFPWRRGVRFTTGLVYNDNHARVLVSPTESYEMEGKVFAPERIGTIQAKLSHRRSVHPYAGIGFGNPVSRRFGFSFDLGVLHTGPPAVEMTGTGLIAPTAEQAPDVEASLKPLTWYPRLSFGMSVRLF